MLEQQQKLFIARLLSSEPVLEPEGLAFVKTSVTVPILLHQQSQYPPS